MDREYNRVVVEYSNGITEVKDYSQYLRIGYQRKEEKVKHSRLYSLKNENLGRKKNNRKFNPENVTKNIFRAKSKIRMLCNHNEHMFHSFITLTFAEFYGEDDIIETNYIFKKFVQRLRYKYPDFQYIAVPELQKSGRVHYHMISSVKYIPVKELESIWNHGYIDIQPIDILHHVSGYLTSYIEKDFGKAFPGRKHFYYSKGLKFPDVKKIDSEKDSTKYDINNLSYQNKVENAYCGVIHTKIYDKNFSWDRSLK